MDKILKLYLIVFLMLLHGCGVSHVKKITTMLSGKRNFPKPVVKKKESEEIPSIKKNLSVKKNNDIWEYIIGKGDVLTISLWRRTKAEIYDIKVRENGKISFLFIDDLKVDGLSLSEVHSLLIDKLKLFYKKPRIDVTVKEYNSKYIYLMGEINFKNDAGQLGARRFPLKGKTTLIDLILSAGGPTKKANLTDLEINRNNHTYKINILDTIFKGDKGKGIILENRDVIIVPSLDKGKFGDRVVYVIGDVKNQGAFKFSGEIGLIKALTLAGGENISASKKNIKIIRGDISNPVLLTANLDKYFNDFDLSQNFPIEHGDIVYVPNTALKNISNFFQSIQPILQTLLYPGNFRDVYTTGGGLRIDTGEYNPSGITTISPSQ